MKFSKYILFLALTFCIPSCIDLDVPPMNIVQDKDIFSSENGVKSYLATLYNNMFIEDFRYSAARGFRNPRIYHSASGITGEALNRGVYKCSTEKIQIWNDAYKLLRNINYFLENMPKYKDNVKEEQYNTWMGEVYFLRAHTFHALAKRYGGVPVVTTVLNYPEVPAEELVLPRNSEEEVYAQMEKDFDKAIELLPETNEIGRANKYAAAAFKSRAMLFAGCIAKYNTVDLRDKHNQELRLCGVPREKATYYFKAAYDAAKMVEGHYSLYKEAWKADDKEAQFKNYVEMFRQADGPETIFAKQYSYPETTHSFDVYNVPRQQKVDGWTACINPSLNYVEMFDGIPKDENGQIKTVDDAGNYILFDKQTDLFKDAEPRLRATVIFPGEVFKGEVIEIWRGIYKGDETVNIPKLQKDPNTTTLYEKDPDCKDLIVSSTSSNKQTVYTLSNGQKMNACGRSGCFNGTTDHCMSGFPIRKFINPDTPISQTLGTRSEQPWPEMRYAEVLLNRAEAAYELYEEGQSDADYKQDAFECVNLVRERAGADMMASKNDVTKEIVRKERRKELSFENKAMWDLRRWRVAHIEQNSTRYRALYPFYADKAGKWFFDARFDQKNSRFTFDTRWYYSEIPSSEVVKSDLTQNPGY